MVKDFPREKWDDGSRPNISVKDAINFCLEQIDNDDTFEFDEDFIQSKNARLSIEELIGTLLLARDVIDHIESIMNDYDARITGEIDDIINNFSDDEEIHGKTITKQKFDKITLMELLNRRR